MTISQSPAQYATARGITEILHFTTNRGLLGVFHTGAVLSRSELDDDQTLDSIRFPNNASRSRDIEWVGHVNLSISAVNKWMFSKSRGWHQLDGVWWAVLAFDVDMLDDAGVQFATTNNVYPSVKHGSGVEGLAALFADEVEWGKFGSIRTRYGKSDSHTTCPQAEVLYPGRIPIQHLRRIHLAEPEHIDEIAGWIATYPEVPDVEVLVTPEIFQ